MEYIYSFIISGDYPLIGVKEIERLIKAKDVKFHVLSHKYKLLRITTCISPKRLLELLYESACLQKIVLERSCESGKVDLRTILRTVEKIDWSYLEGKSFCVFVDKIVKIPIPSPKIAKEVGNIIKSKIPLSRVDLENPDIKVNVILHEGLVVIGDLIWKFRRDRFKFRKPDLRPAFSPCALTPTFAKVLINLGLTNPPGRMLDPFCGVGSILVEAALMGIYSIGVDVKRTLIKECRRNLMAYSSYPLVDLIVADAKSLPLREEAIRMVITDLPYGKLSPTLSRDPNELTSKFLKEITYSMKKGSRAVLVYDRELPDAPHLKILERYRVYVHRSLTRVIHLAVPK